LRALKADVAGVTMALVQIERAVARWIVSNADPDRQLVEAMQTVVTQVDAVQRMTSSAHTLHATRLTRRS